MNVTDPFDTVTAALDTHPDPALWTPAKFALASIEERLRETERERDDLRQKRDSVGTLAVEEAIGRSKAEIRIAELEEALLPFAEAANDKLPVDSVLNARRALATSEQARSEEGAA